MGRKAAAHAKYRPENIHYTSTIIDAEWLILEPLMPAAAGTGRPRLHSLRAVLGAVFHVLVAGCQWRNLPSDFPLYSTVQNWFYRWRTDGTMVRLNHALLIMEPERVGREAAPSAGSMISRASRRSRAVRVGPADEQDRDGIVPLLARICGLQPWLRHSWADGGYAGQKLRDAADKIGGWKIEIVKRSDKMSGFVLLPRR